MDSARLLASLLCVLLVSCGTTRSTVAPATEEFTHYVLVLEESPGGQVTEHWRHAEEFDLSWYRFPTSARASTYGRIVRVAKSYQRDCDAENRQCIELCMSRPLPRGLGHTTSGGRGKGGKLEWCDKSNADNPTATAWSWRAAILRGFRPWTRRSTG
jgi:hypothetical protein